MTLPFNHTHALDLGIEISRSESEIALSQEWGSRLTWNENDGSHPSMIMILTSVTSVWWADIPDSDRGDFRRRRAVDISSYVAEKVILQVHTRGEPFNDTTRAGGSPLLSMRMHVIFLELDTTLKSSEKVAQICKDPRAPE